MEASTRARGIVIAGEEGSGKSAIAEKWAAHCGRPVFLYNSGDDGFENYKEVDFLSPSEAATYQGLNTKQRREYLQSATACDFFQIDGKTYRAADFTKAMHVHRYVKFYGTIGGAKENDDFFTMVNLYGRGIALILDDTRSIFRNGLSSKQLALFSRKSHTGKRISEGFLPSKRGVEVVFIFHNLDQVNSEIWNYSSHAVLFRCTQEPLDNVKNKYVLSAVKKAYTYLLDAQKYTYCTIPFKGANAYQITTTNGQGKNIAGPK